MNHRVVTFALGCTI